jgi:uncharacterized SAM-binding protein YcdF (DUF218 family)
MSFISFKAFSAALLPPFALLLLAALGLLLMAYRRRAGVVLICAAFTGLFLLSLPVAAMALASLIEGRANDGKTAPGNAQAIVILGGGSYMNAPEYGADTVSSSTLERLR